MNKVRMLKTQKGVPDGEIQPVSFMEGQEYEIGDGLLHSFIDLGIVELADETGEKSQGDAPANKARKAAPENMSR